MVFILLYSWLLNTGRVLLYTLRFPNNVPGLLSSLLYSTAPCNYEVWTLDGDGDMDQKSGPLVTERHRF